MPSTTLPIGQIEISPLNVRTYRPDQTDTAGLEASILAEGLLNAIDVHPMRGRKNYWGAIAGGRRTRAIKALVDRGDLPADWPVPVNLHEGLSDAQLVELSITENLIRRDLREHELFAGVARAARLGHDVEQIAHGTGQRDTRVVARWLRLGRLAPPVFAAFTEGTIDRAQAQAYAATEDRDLQAAVFAQLSAGFLHKPKDISAAMNIGDAVQRRHLSFVGEVVYRGAGGRYELDLFADTEDRGRVVDAGILARLVEEKLATIRDQVRVNTQRRDLRFVPEPPHTNYGYPDNQLVVMPKKKGEHLELPAGSIVAHIEIDAAGEPNVSYWWESRKAKFGTDKPGAGKPVSAAASAPRVDRSQIGDAIGDPYRARPQADAAIREEDGLTFEGTNVMLALRKAIVRGALLADAREGGDVAGDYLAWSQARALFGGFDDGKLGISKLPPESDVGMGGVLDAMRGHVAASPAGIALKAALEELHAHPSMQGDLAAGFLLFRAAPPALKRLAASIAAGIALRRSLNAPGYAVPLHDAIVAEAGAADDAEVRHHWSPTREVLDFFPKAQRLTMADEVVPEAVRRNWSKLKSGDLTDALLRALPADWVHPLLHFDAGAGRAAANQPELAEAAE